MEISIIRETKQIIEDAYEKYNELNNKYYKDILDFLNLLYSEDCKQLLKIKFKKITLCEDVFLLYNEIIKEYKLNKNLFDINNFNISEIYDFSEIFEIAFIMTNNLLEKLNYKVVKYFDKDNNKKVLKIKKL